MGFFSEFQQEKKFFPAPGSWAGIFRDCKNAFYLIMKWTYDTLMWYTNIETLIGW